jgi:hypothetical protein
MSSRCAKVMACVLSVGLWPARAMAQSEHWTVDFGGGGAPTTGEISSRLTTGWNVAFDAGYEFDNGVGLIGEFAYGGLGVADQVLQNLQVPSGTAHMISLTAGPRWRVLSSTHVNFDVRGGVGWYRRTVEFTQPTVALIDVFDPWWGYLGPVAVPANQVLGSVTRNAWGANIGGGVGFPLGDSGTELFVDIRYHYAHTRPTTTSFVPISFGFRWTGQRPRS